MSLSMQTFALVKDRALSMDMCNGKAGHMSQGPVHGHVQWQGPVRQPVFTYPISDCKDICNCKVMILVVVRGLRGRAHVTCATPLARAS